MYKGSSDLSHTPVESFSLSIFLSRAPRERRVNERLLMGERGVDTVGCHPSNNIGGGALHATGPKAMREKEGRDVLECIV